MDYEQIQVEYYSGQDNLSKFQGVNVVLSVLSGFIESSITSQVFAESNIITIIHTENKLYDYYLESRYPAFRALKRRRCRLFI